MISWIKNPRDESKLIAVEFTPINCFGFSRGKAKVFPFLFVNWYLVSGWLRVKDRPGS